MNYAIIAAGEGSRLAQEGVAKPKPLVELQGEPMIGRLINIMLRCNAESISIIVNEHMTEVRQYLESLELPVPLNLVVKTTPSSMHSFWHLSQVIPQGKFCLTTVDTIFREEDFKGYIEAFEADEEHDGMWAVTPFVDDEKPLWVEVDDQMGITAFRDKKWDGAQYVSGGVYAMTKENIDEQKRVAALAAYRVVVPEAETFETDAQVQDALDELSGQVYGSGFGRAYIDEAYTGLDADGNPVGYAVRVTTADGFDGNIVLAVGLDTEGRVNGISFTELNETPGMGMRCDEPEFRDQFNGKAVEAFKLTKAGEAAADDEIDTVSGASTTSGAVVNAVNAALDFYNNFVKGGA